MQTTIKQAETTQKRPQRTIKDYLGLVLRGMAMGASDIVPGVSGGTMAFILGIYEELIDSIRTIGRSQFLQAVFKFRIKDIFQILNWPFLLAVLTGILLSIVTMSSALEYLLINQPIFLWSFFFGLVLASVFVVSKRVQQWSALLVGTLLLGAVAAYLLVGLVPVQTPDAWWFLMLSGAVASCALILPGVSGAFLLVLLGKYQFVLSAVNGLRGGEINNIFPLLFVAGGAGVGLVSFAQILGWLFKRHHDLTVALLIGLMAGSLRKIWPWKVDLEWLRDSLGNFVLDSNGHRLVTKQANVLPDFASSAGLNEILLALLLALVGIGLILLVDRLAAELEK